MAGVSKEGGGHLRDSEVLVRSWLKIWLKAGLKEISGECWRWGAGGGHQTGLWQHPRAAQLQLSPFQALFNIQNLEPGDQSVERDWPGYECMTGAVNTMLSALSHGGAVTLAGVTVHAPLYTAGVRGHSGHSQPYFSSQLSSTHLNSTSQERSSTSLLWMASTTQTVRRISDRGRSEGCVTPRHVSGLQEVTVTKVAAG